MHKTGCLYEAARFFQLAIGNVRKANLQVEDSTLIGTALESGCSKLKFCSRELPSLEASAFEVRRNECSILILKPISKKIKIEFSIY